MKQNGTRICFLAFVSCQYKQPPLEGYGEVKVKVSMTPSHFVLNSSWNKVRLAITLFKIGERKYSTGARSGE
jgi:hypothetical protein